MYKYNMVVGRQDTSLYPSFNIKNRNLKKNQTMQVLRVNTIREKWNRNINWSKYSVRKLMPLWSCKLTGIMITFKGFKNTTLYHINTTSFYLWSRDMVIKEKWWKKTLSSEKGNTSKDFWTSTGHAKWWVENKKEGLIRNALP